jgi:hypothetical protein
LNRNPVVGRHELFFGRYPLHFHRQIQFNDIAFLPGSIHDDVAIFFPVFNRFFRSVLH